jgi:hypothetical protein
LESKAERYFLPLTVCYKGQYLLEMQRARDIQGFKSDLATDNALQKTALSST